MIPVIPRTCFSWMEAFRRQSAVRANCVTSGTDGNKADEIVRNYGGILCHVCLIRIPRREFEKHFLKNHFGNKDDIIFCGEHMVPLRKRKEVRKHMPCLRKESRRSTRFQCFTCGYRCVSEQHHEFHVDILHMTMICSACKLDVYHGYAGLLAHKKKCRRVPWNGSYSISKIGVLPRRAKAKDTVKKVVIEDVQSSTRREDEPISDQHEAETSFCIIDEYVPPSEEEQSSDEMDVPADQNQCSNLMQSTDQSAGAICGNIFKKVMFVDDDKVYRVPENPVDFVESKTNESSVVT
ncbi:hypothetical protein M514_06410 [Trichuris suis]|uniref:Uncharacterized protein n=1 Tax=Trichuris suis TaxID=68888 RepID=A0A085NPZ4_9BILA|nr:hypothetical protein M514_06410 [Trichuris suis]